jgi:hypothetical protein
MPPTRIQGAQRAAQDVKLPSDRRSTSAANSQRRPQESVASLEPSQHKEISRKIKLELTVVVRPQLIKLNQLVDAIVAGKHRASARCRAKAVLAGTRGHQASKARQDSAAIRLHSL